jgi:hypothetical protein
VHAGASAPASSAPSDALWDGSDDALVPLLALPPAGAPPRDVGAASGASWRAAPTAAARFRAAIAWAE